MKLLSKALVIFLGFTALILLSSCEDEDAQAAKGHEKVCTAADMKLAINPNNAQFPKQMDKCASDAWGDEEKTTKCLKKLYPSLSSGCASCFGKTASCSASNCKGKCLFNHFSDGCLSCVNTNCKQIKSDNSFSLISCTGIKEKELPPNK